MTTNLELKSYFHAEALENMQVSALSHCRKRTSLYAFGREFRYSRNIASDRDVSGSKQYRIFSYEKLEAEKNVHGVLPLRCRLELFL